MIYRIIQIYIYIFHCIPFFACPADVQSSPACYICIAKEGEKLKKQREDAEEMRRPAFAWGLQHQSE